jgi:cell division GTPase FtsZ
MTLEAASQVVDLMTSKVSDDAHVIWGARQDPGFGDTIKVMAIMTGVGGQHIQGARVSPDKLGEALKLTKQRKEAGAGNTGFHRFE